MINKRKNKKGNIWITLLIFGGLFLLIMFGILMAIGSSILNWTMDTVVPELDTIGENVGGANFTDINRIVIRPVDTVIQNFTWLTGLLYIFGMISLFGISFVYRGTGDRWLIALFFGLMLILIIASILLSNIYQDFHDGTDDIATRLQEHTMLSFLIIYSPLIVTIISVIAGVLLYGVEQEI